jgi:hypothetical protein
VSARPKDIGTRAESAVVKYLAANGWPNAERRALHGNVDLGDVTGTPGLAWEVKGGEAAKTASDKQIAAWFEESQQEAANAGAIYGFLIVARRRKNVRDWWAAVHVSDLSELFRRDSMPLPSEVHCLITLAQLVELLAAAGWAGGGQ